MELALAIISVIIDLVMLFVTINSSSHNNSQTSSQNVNIKNTTTIYSYEAPSSHDDIGLYIICFLIAGSLYTQYSNTIALIISILGIVSVIVFFLTAKANNESNIPALIITSLTYIFTFFAIYFFKNPIYATSLPVPFGNIFSPVFSMLGGLLICVLFFKQVYHYVIKKQMLKTSNCILYCAVSFLATVITSGYLLYFLSQVPL